MVENIKIKIKLELKIKLIFLREKIWKMKSRKYYKETTE